MANPLRPSQCLAQHTRSAVPPTLLQVGRNNFRPPPKVDSSVVRIELRHPPPPINFLEWDGLVRLCFGRKNKTLGATFRQNHTLQLLEANHRTWQALQLGTATGTQAARLEDAVSRMAVDIPEQTDDDAMSMDLEAEGTAPLRGGGKKGRYSEEFKQKVLGVLDQHGFTEQRSAKMAQDDFLRLLAAFNSAGIHFA